MSKGKAVTILIPVYNAKNTIKDTIESIKNQKYCGDIYINIIDDGSTDGSLELLKSMELDSKTTILELERRSILAFIFYVLLYAFILAPYCLIGYISELINSKKKW